MKSANAIVAIVLGLAPSISNASVVQFDNSSRRFNMYFVDGGIGGAGYFWHVTSLDITQDSSQPEFSDLTGGTRFAFGGVEASGNTGTGSSHFVGALVTGPTRTLASPDRTMFVTVTGPRMFLPTEQVGAGLVYDDYTFFGFQADHSGISPPSFNMWTSEGYVGVRFTLNGNTHYGWIYFNFTLHPSPPSMASWQPVRWAYESEPDTPIAIPGCALCTADFNTNGGIDGGDIEAFFASWEAGAACADVNQDGAIDGADVEFFFGKWQSGVC